MPTAARKSPPKKLSPVGGGKLGTASLKVVNGFASAPDGTFRSGTVRAILSQGATITANQEVVPESVTARIKPDGTWTLSLYSNSDLTPSGTYYTVTEIFDDGASYAYTIVIPGTAGPFNVASIQTGVPPSASPTPGHLSTLIVDGQVTFTGGPLSFPNGSLPESVIVNLTADLAARALDSTVVHLAGAETITGLKTLTAPLQLSEITTPAAPTAGIVQLYAKNDGRLYRQTSVGGEVPSELSTYNIRDFGATGLGTRVYDGTMSVALADPTIAPTVALSTAAAQLNMPAGTYTFAYSYTNAAGETNLSPASAPITTTGPNPSVSVTLPGPVPMGGATAKLYVVSGPAGSVGYTGVTLTTDGGTVSYTTVTVSQTPNSGAAPGSNTTGSVAANVLSSGSALFTAGMVGWHALVVGVGDAVYGSGLLTTIQSFTDSQHVVLANNAVIGSTRALVCIWSDAMATADTAGLTGAFTSMGVNAGRVVAPPANRGRFGFYACSVELTVLQSQYLAGTSKRACAILDVASVGVNDAAPPVLSLDPTAANPNMPPGTYFVGVTYVTARGETALLTENTASITTTGPNPSILVNYGAIPAGVTLVKVWIYSGPGGTIGYTGVSATAGTQVLLSQAGGALSAAVIVGGGTGYTAGDILTVQGGTGAAATLKVQQVNAGVIQAVGINGAGAYSTAPTNPVSVAGGTGTGATFNLTFVPSTIYRPISNTTQLLVRQPSAAYSSVADLELIAGKTTTALLRVQDTSYAAVERVRLDGGANPYQVDCFTLTNNTPSAGGCYYDSFSDIQAFGGKLGFNLQSIGNANFINNHLFKACFGNFNRNAGWYLNQVQGCVFDACEAEQNGKLYYVNLAAQATPNAGTWGYGIRMASSPRCQWIGPWVEGNRNGTLRLDNSQDGLKFWPSALSQYAADGGGNGLSGVPSFLGRDSEVEDMSVTPEVIYTTRRRNVYNGGTLQVVEGTSSFSYLNGTFLSVTTVGTGGTGYASTAGGDSVTRYAILGDGTHQWGPGNASRDTFLARSGVGILAVTGALTVSTDLTITGRLLFGAGASKIVPGVTSLSHRNNADTADNLLISDAGLVTVRNGLTVTAGDLIVTAGRVVMSVAASKLVPGATSFSHRNNADTADNLLITDAGVIAARSFFTVTAASAASAYAATVSGDGTTRFVIDVSGTHTWGPGNAGRDVTLARTAAGTLTLTATGAPLFLVGPGASLSWSGLTLGYGTGAPAVASSVASGESSIGLNTNDGTRNQRAKFFLDDTAGVWGLYQSYGTSVDKPFVISSVNTEYVRLDFADNSWQLNGSMRLRFGVATNAMELLDTAGTNGRRLQLQPKGQASSTASAQFQLVPGANVDHANQIASQILLFNVPGANYERYEVSAVNDGFVHASTVVGTGTLRSIMFQMGAAPAFYIDTGGNLRSYLVHDFGYALANTVRIVGAANGAAPEISARGTTDANVNLRLTPKGTGVVDFNYASIALGGGAAPTFGTIGGSGPATAAQSGWKKEMIQGVASYVPFWR